MAYTGFSQLLGVYTGSALNNLSPTAQGVIDPITLAATAGFTATAGTTYQILVDGSAGQSGTIELKVELQVPVLGSPGYIPTGQFSFTFTAPPNARYVIESTTDLINWPSVTTGTVPPDGTIVFVEPPANVGVMRFYRVRLL